MINKPYRIVWLLLLLPVLVGCPEKPAENDAGAEKKDKAPVAKKLSKTRQQILSITQSESLLQSLSPKMSKLAGSFKKRGGDTSGFAADEIEYDHGLSEHDFDQWLAANADTKGDFAAMVYWPLDEGKKKVPLKELWGPVKSKYVFEDAQIGSLKASFPNSQKEFVVETKFEGRLRTEKGEIVGFKGKQTITWEEVEPENWKVTRWKQKELKLVRAPDTLFTDITKKVIPDQQVFETVSNARHPELIVKRAGEINASLSIRDIHEKYEAFSDWESTGQYPSVSVVDFDNDGLDDIFVTDRWQAPTLLRNEGDQTFSDATAKAGLTDEALNEFVNCGYFFDYDNDGDADLLIGFSVKPSLFYENNGDGTFSPHEKINKVLDEARVVVAAAAADVNRDGLLDLYLCTYSSATGPIENWIQHVTKPSERVKTRLRIERADRFVDRGGPPNILLLNRGDTFEWAKMDDTLKQYRSSYQASWMDFDNDGDADLYVCNDFSPDVFLRNDTEQGSFEPKFENVTKTIAPTVQMGFGMGTSFGDFDNDADLDLYVCNMYSKAGNRIIAQLDEVDERLAVGARGNFLYENQGETYRQIAGDGPDEQHINVVGWSFGGQFADFDNDGFLDLFVPSGFYSAPKEVKAEVDL